MSPIKRCRGCQRFYDSMTRTWRDLSHMNPYLSSQITSKGVEVDNSLCPDCQKPKVVRVPQPLKGARTAPVFKTRALEFGKISQVTTCPLFSDQVVALKTGNAHRVVNA